jgi:hypothetical protein
MIFSNTLLELSSSVPELVEGSLELETGFSAGLL